MLVSIVMPVYNDEAHLADAIERALGQQDVEVEVVVVDDGSSDRSREVARAAAERDPRVTFVPLPANGGAARAREHGVRAAGGEWIWFVDSDDDWPTDAAARLLAAAAAHPDADVVVAGARYVYEAGRSPRPVAVPSGPPVPGREAFSLLLTGAVTGHLWNKLFRRKLLLGIEFTPARVQSDLAMVAQALARSACVAFSPAHVYDYRVRGGSIITSRPQRAESLRLVADAVGAAAAHVQPPVIGTSEHRYFVLRYLTLSGIKDAVQGSYDPDERARLLGELRRRIGLRELAVLARRRDARRLAFALTARTSLRAYRKLLAVADRGTPVP